MDLLFVLIFLFFVVVGGIKLHPDHDDRDKRERENILIQLLLDVV